MGGAQPQAADAATLEPQIEGLRPSDVILSIADLEQMALSHNPTIAAAARQIQALRGKYIQQGLYPNPVIGYIGEEIGIEGRPGQQGVSIGQQVVTAGKLDLNRAVVSHEIAAAQQDLEIQRGRVINDVRAAAYQVLTAQRTIALSEQLVRIGQEGQDVAQELLKAREVSQVDLLRARVESNSAKILLANAQRFSGCLANLASVVGIPDMQPAVLQDNLAEGPPALTWDGSLARLLGSSPELARSLAGVERAQCELARQYAGRVPDISLSAGVRYAFGAEDTIATVGLGVPLQIFDRNQGNILRARGNSPPRVRKFAESS